MKNLYLEGGGSFNNSLTLPPGRLSVDSEKKALWLHDGNTQGGFEVTGTMAIDPSLGPGSKELVAGTMTAGFFGEVSSEELLTYSELNRLVGLSHDTSEFNNESLWLKFALDGNILYISKKPASVGVSWSDVNRSDAVLEGGLQVSVDSHMLDVTLLRGANSDPTVRSEDGLWIGHDIDLSNGSEWNRLMYPIHSGIHSNTSNPSVHTDTTAEPFGSWATYSDSDLRFASGTGRFTWCQEVSGDNTSNRVTRGQHGIAYSGTTINSAGNSNWAWRPCLRLVV